MLYVYEQILDSGRNPVRIPAGQTAGSLWLPAVVMFCPRSAEANHAISVSSVFSVVLKSRPAKAGCQPLCTFCPLWLVFLIFSASVISEFLCVLCGLLDLLRCGTGPTAAVYPVFQGLQEAVYNRHNKQCQAGGGYQAAYQSHRHSPPHFRAGG